jgi:putative intracellular protease/amidase
MVRTPGENGRQQTARPAAGDPMSERAAGKILAVVTSHDAYENSDEKTGLWLGELTHFWEVVAEAGYDIDVVSTEGGQVPLDKRSLGITGGARRSNREFLANPQLHAKLKRSLRPEDVSIEDYEAIYFAGGHGAMWDFRGNPELARLAEAVDRGGGVISAVCHGVAALLELKHTDGSALIAGQPVTGYANAEERILRKTNHLPYLLQDELVRHGGSYRRGRLPFASHIEIGERLVTGQNPLSSKAVARAVVELLQKSDTGE